MKNKSVMATGIANFAGSSSVKEPVREMGVPGRPCHVALRLSGRGEFEITDVNHEYIRQGDVGYSVLDGYWSDAGTFEGWVFKYYSQRAQRKAKTLGTLWFK